LIINESVICMILAIDIGNTHITFGCIDRDKAADPVLRLPTDRLETEYGYAARLKQIFDIIKIDPVGLDGSVISSVVPEVTEMMRRACNLIIGKEPLIVGPGIKTGLVISLDSPDSLAPDIIAAAVAAGDRYSMPCIMIDMGTATTVTVLDKNGAYVGGAIMPGAGTSLAALSGKASLLPSVSIRKPEKAIEDDTVGAMQSGIFYGTVGSIDGVLKAFISELGEEPEIVATGGLAKLVCPYCEHKIILDEELLLRGLMKIWEMNETGK
jgi:type III pantothenate kinase